VLRHGATTSEVEIVALKRKLSAVLGTALLAASLTACDSGGETDDGNSGDQTPTAVPTNDENSDEGVDGDDDDSNTGPDGSGE
jgi:hypothetical protein